MIVFLLKASVVVLAMLTFYKIFLEKESFFAANRMYLFLGLLLIVALPFIPLPNIVKGQGIISEKIELITPKGKFVSTIQENPVSEPIIRDSNSTPYVLKTIHPDKEKGLTYWLLVVYYFGAAVLLLNLISQIIGILLKVIRSSDRVDDAQCIIINIELVKEPCSFFRYIFLNPESYDFETYEQIIEHEKIHVKKRHTFDLILSEIIVVVLWFNPFIWLYRKEVEKNLEYQTDNLLINNNTVEKEKYQMNLLEIATLTRPLTVTTNYNQSLVKQRILKMNSKKSNPQAYWKYAFTAPLLLTLLISMNKPFSMEGQLSDNERPTYDSQQELDTYKDVNWLTEQEEKLAKIPDSNCTQLLIAIKEMEMVEIKRLLKTVNPNCIDPNPESETITLGSDSFTITGPRTALVAAAKYGNTQIGKLLIDSGANIEFHAEHDKSPLISAAANGHLDFVKYLLSQGAQINRAVQGEGTAILAATRNGDLEIVKYLLQEGADMERVITGEGTPLLAAARDGNTQIVEYLISKGADVNMQIMGEGTALVGAAQNGHMETAKYLLENGANINGQDLNESTPLIESTRNGHIDMVNYLLSKGAVVDAVSLAEGTALIGAVQNQHYDVAKLLLENGADPYLTTPGNGYAMFHARNSKDDDMIALLNEYKRSN